MTSANYFNVNSAPTPQMPTQTKPVNKAGDEKEMMKDFSKIMSSVDAGRVQNTGAANANNANLQGAVQETTKQSQAQNTQSAKQKDDKRDDPVLNQNAKNPVKEKQSPSDEEIADKVEEAVDKFESDVKDVISEALDTDDATVDEAIETLGLLAIDLAEPQNVTAVIGEIDGEDNLSILMKDNVSDVLNQVADLKTEMVQEIGLDLTEIRNIYTDLKENALEADGPEMPEFAEGAETPEVVLELSPDAKSGAIPIPEDMTPVEDGEEIPADLLKNAEALRADDAMRPEARPVNDDAAKSVRPEEDFSDERPILNADTQAEASRGDEAQTDANSGQQSGNPANENRNLFAEMNQNPIETNPMNENVNVNAQQPSFADAVQNAPETPYVPERYSDVNPQDVMNQIVEQARTNISENTRSIEMVLNPEHLGRVYLEVSTKDGQTSARLVTENENVKAALENQMMQLRENLNNQGLKIESVEVSVGTHEFDQALEENQMHENARQEEEERAAEEAERQQRPRNLHIDDLEDDALEMTEEEELNARMMREQGNTMDYRA